MTINFSPLWIWWFMRQIVRGKIVNLGCMISKAITLDGPWARPPSKKPPPHPKQRKGQKHPYKTTLQSLLGYPHWPFSLSIKQKKKKKKNSHRGGGDGSLTPRFLISNPPTRHRHRHQHQSRQISLPLDPTHHPPGILRVPVFPKRPGVTVDQEPTTAHNRKQNTQNKKILYF
jgi:hypothetical protein